VGQALKRLALPHRLVAGDVVEHFRLAHKKRAVDPAFGRLWFLAEGRDLVSPRPREFQVPEPGRRADGGQGAQFAMRTVILQQLVQIDIGDAIPPGEHEGLVAQVGRQALDAPAGHGRDAGIDQPDPPIRFRAAIHLHLPSPDVHGQIAVQRRVIHHVLLDHFALVAQRNDEVFEVVVGVMHHDVPEDRNPADLDHRFGLDRGLL